MNVLLVRHARAEERALLGRDSRRALTPDGRRRFRQAAKGLYRILPAISLVATSPLVRARQTAEILVDHGDGTELVTLAALAPGKSCSAVLAWLKQQADDATVALVGHEPDLGMLAGWLLTGRDASFIEFKKGAMCLIAFAEAPAPGAGRLLWALAPGVLRRIAG
jgi:phosphohistidine phosphatase